MLKNAPKCQIIYMMRCDSIFWQSHVLSHLSTGSRDKDIPNRWLDIIQGTEYIYIVDTGNSHFICYNTWKLHVKAMTIYLSDILYTCKFCHILNTCAVANDFIIFINSRFPIFKIVCFYYWCKLPWFNL